ncbi:MAG: hypothetical protein R2752_13145 [Vicinamibacterales bacterium]
MENTTNEEVLERAQAEIAAKLAAHLCGERGPPTRKSCSTGISYRLSTIRSPAAALPLEAG